jgi:hypothetical protein
MPSNGQGCTRNARYMLFVKLLILNCGGCAELASCNQLIVKLLSPPMRASVIFTTSAAMPHIGPRSRGEKTRCKR